MRRSFEKRRFRVWKFLVWNYREQFSVGYRQVRILGQYQVARVRLRFIGWDSLVSWYRTFITKFYNGFRVLKFAFGFVQGLVFLQKGQQGSFLFIVIVVIDKYDISFFCREQEGQLFIIRIRCDFDMDRFRIGVCVQLG